MVGEGEAADDSVLRDMHYMNIGLAYVPLSNSSGAAEVINILTSSFSVGIIDCANSIQTRNKRDGGSLTSHAESIGHTAHWSHSQLARRSLILQATGAVVPTTHWSFSPTVPQPNGVTAHCTSVGLYADMDTGTMQKIQTLLVRFYYELQKCPETAPLGNTLVVGDMRSSIASGIVWLVWCSPSSVQTLDTPCRELRYAEIHDTCEIKYEEYFKLVQFVKRSESCAVSLITACPPQYRRQGGCGGNPVNAFPTCPQSTPVQRFPTFETTHGTLARGFLLIQNSTINLLKVSLDITFSFLRHGGRTPAVMPDSHLLRCQCRSKAYAWSDICMNRPR
ncbi:hypothetical protein HOLleu_28141 [Holothuria leucospilota]|uniref:Uncharacterized protein n=1 Tax=Holothuria leucospilota TaxID=206669 RepID=A0A9Q1H031_HOLLE|nr:hypothetical protein HOLleu_28141 [Holothuria leucospilota]